MVHISRVWYGWSMDEKQTSHWPVWNGCTLFVPENDGNELLQCKLNGIGPTGGERRRSYRLRGTNRHEKGLQRRVHDPSRRERHASHCIPIAEAYGFIAPADIRLLLAVRGDHPTPIDGNRSALRMGW